MFTRMDDVVNPPLEEIDGAMYRVNVCDYPGSGQDGVYIEDDEFEFSTEEYDDGDGISNDMPVIEVNREARPYDSHRFKMRLRVPKALHGFLIGTRGQTRMRLEQETRTKILIPKKDEEGDIVLMSSEEIYLRSAYPILQSLITRSRKILSPKPTHFVSIPLNAPNIRERFVTFREQVLECCGNTQEIMTENLFQRPEKLHLTLAVFVLLDEEERRISCRRLDECLGSIIEPLLKNRPITVQIKGIDIFYDDPTDIRVLFAKAKSEDDILQKLADEVSNFFQQDGLTTDNHKRDHDHVKLHVTLMNTKFLEDQNEETNAFRTQKKKRTFDASKILENFKDFDFGVVEVNSLHLSQTHAYSEDGYYLSSNRIKWA